MNFPIQYPSRRRFAYLAMALAFTGFVHAAKPVEVLPPQELTRETLFGLLVGEMALHYGDLQLSSSAYAEMASKTRDPRVARRALDISQAAGQLPQALESARQWTLSAPTSLEAPERYASLLLASKRGNEARDVLKNHLAAHPRRAKDVFMQLDTWMSRVPGDKTPHLPLTETLTSAFATLPEAHYALAAAALNDNQPARGLVSVDKALKSRAKWPEAALVKAGLLQLKDPAAAVQWLLSWQKSFGLHPLTNSYLARLYLTQDKMGEARLAYERQIELNERDAYAPYAAGLIAREQKDHAAAIRFLQRAVDRGYRDVDAARYYIGDSLAQLKQVPPALQVLDSIQDGDWGLRALARATLLRVRSGQLDLALTKIAEARTRQDYADLWQFQGDALREAGKLPEALQALHDGLQAFPDDDGLLYARAMIFDRQGKYGEAEKDLRQVLKKTPDDPTTLNALGYMLADRSDRLEEARELIEKAHALKPEDPFILDSLGWVYVRLGKLQQGLDNLQKAYATQADPEIAAHLVENLWLLGRKDEARNLWQGATRKHPEHDALKNVQRTVLDKP